MNKILVGNIQRFSLHDGPGIRTTVFFMGCSIHCPWCANPENLAMQQCSYPNANDLYGKYYSPTELVDEILKDEIFFADGGGVTFSGGEVLLQALSLLEILRELKKRHIHIAIETALFVPLKYLQQVADYVDLWMIDVKILEYQLCKEILGGDINVYIDNFSWLTNNCKAYVLRFPIVYGITLAPSNINLLLKFLRRYSVKEIEIFAIHDFAKEKYRKLGMKFMEYQGVSDDEIIKLQDKIEEQGTKCKILKIS